MVAMMRMGKRGREGLEGVSFGEWLEKHGQEAGLVRKFYEPVLVSALNEHCRRASAKYAIQVFQDALLANERGYPVGLPACPLGELYERVPVGDVRVGTRVEEVMWEGEGTRQKAVGVRLRGGEELRGDAVVLATNHHAVQRWVEELGEAVEQRDGRFAGLEKLESVPILGAHLWFDRPVMGERAVAAGGGGGRCGGGWIPGDSSRRAWGDNGGIEGGLQWLFKKDEEGKVVHGVIGGARAWVSVPKEEALKRFEGRCGDWAGWRDAKLERGVIVIEKRATFSPVPGSDGWRPGQVAAAGGVTNLFLAGDYTKTDWPATMEGAVRSGYLAAEAVSGERFLVADLPVQWPGADDGDVRS